MAGNVTDNNGEISESAEALTKLHLSEHRGTRSSSPPYWDTDDDNEDGPKPSMLYGRYTWKIKNLFQTSNIEVKSEVFVVGGYQWYILIHPRGCNVQDYISLFLCVANRDKLPPGWSHFAQFTIAVINKDPKESKFSDTLHRFWKKEHDWGWKKFMELSKVRDGFIIADTLEIRAQIQVIREKPNRPFRCLDRQYRRELVRVYLSDVEQKCRMLVEESRSKFCLLIDDKDRWSSFCDFWLGIDQSTKYCLSREKTDVIMRLLVRRVFLEREITSTLLMDALYCGLKSLIAEINIIQGKPILLDSGDASPPYISVEDDMFALTDDALVLLHCACPDPLLRRDYNDRSQYFRKVSSSNNNCIKEALEQDERGLTVLGRATIETFVLAHIYSEKLEVAFEEDNALIRQEALIREEEELKKKKV